MAQKDTKAMEMIASSKKKAQNRIFEARAFMAGIVDVITDIAGQTNSLSDPLLMPHKEEKDCPYPDNWTEAFAEDTIQIL